MYRMYMYNELTVNIQRSRFILIDREKSIDYLSFSACLVKNPLECHEEEEEKNIRNKEERGQWIHKEPEL